MLFGVSNFDREAIKNNAETPGLSGAGGRDSNEAVARLESGKTLKPTERQTTTQSF
jgi:hypothetical protein